MRLLLERGARLSDQTVWRFSSHGPRAKPANGWVLAFQYANDGVMEHLLDPATGLMAHDRHALTSEGTLLHLAVHHSAKALEQTLAMGVAIDRRDLEGVTALASLAHRRFPTTFNIAQAERLLQAGSNPNLMTYGERNTVLHLAAQQGSDGLAALLLRYGADPHRRNANGQQAHEVAMALGHGAVAARLERAVMRHELDDRHASSDALAHPLVRPRARL